LPVSQADAHARIEFIRDSELWVEKQQTVLRSVERK
jgi:hypothetical protein